MIDAAINGLMFNISWFIIVVTHDNRVALAVVVLHLGLHFFRSHEEHEAPLIIGVCLCGLVVDRMLFASGILTQTSGDSTPPLWLSCLWPVFATTLLHLFRFLHGRLLIAVPIGAMGGAGSYLAGTQLSDITLATMPSGPLLLAVLWAVLLPALLFIATRPHRSHQRY